MFYNFIKHLTSQNSLFLFLKKLFPMCLPEFHCLFKPKRYYGIGTNTKSMSEIIVNPYRHIVLTQHGFQLRKSLLYISESVFILAPCDGKYRQSLILLSHSSPDHTSGKSLSVSAVLLCDSSPRNLRRNMP